MIGTKGAQPMASTFETYKKFRNKVADLSFADSFAATWAFSQFTQVRGFKFPRDVEFHNSFTADGKHQPYCWQLETLIREVVLNSSEANRRGRSLRKWADLANIVDELRGLEDRLHEDSISQDNILRELFRIAHQQFPWQRRPTTRTVGRYYRIFNTEQIDTICRAQTTLSIAQVYAIGSGLWGLFTNKPFTKLPMESTIKGIDAQDISAFTSRFGCELYALRRLIKEQHVVDDTFSLDNRRLRAHPLIVYRYGGVDYAVCPLPTLLYWRFTSGLYYDLMAEPEFYNAFGASFQAFIGEVLKRALSATSIKLLPEEKYGPKGKSKDTIDWLMLDKGAAVFVECKTKRLRLDAKINLLSTEALIADIGILADAVVQVYATIRDYREGRYPSLPYDKSLRIYPMIVTLENWYPLGNPVLSELEKAVQARLAEKKLPPDMSRELPYVIAAAEEFEVAAQIIAKVGCERFFEGFRDKQYQGWMLEGYMSHAFKAENNAAVDLFAGTYEEILRPFKGA